jgi:hypothetical protein
MELMAPESSVRRMIPKPSAQLSDAQLLSQAVTDRALFEDVFVRHVSAVYRYLARRVDAAAVEDLVAETFKSSRWS